MTKPKAKQDITTHQWWPVVEQMFELGLGEEFHVECASRGAAISLRQQVYKLRREAAEQGMIFPMLQIKMEIKGANLHIRNEGELRMVKNGEVIKVRDPLIKKAKTEGDVDTDKPLRLPVIK